jgi:hypothetical protein
VAAMRAVRADGDGIEVGHAASCHRAPSEAIQAP